MVTRGSPKPLLRVRVLLPLPSADFARNRLFFIAFRVQEQSTFRRTHRRINECICCMLHSHRHVQGVVIESWYWLPCGNSSSQKCVWKHARLCTEFQHPGKHSGFDTSMPRKKVVHHWFAWRDMVASAVEQVCYCSRPSALANLPEMEGSFSMLFFLLMYVFYCVKMQTGNTLFSFPYIWA